MSRIMAAHQDWNVRFYGYSEPFLDTTGPFAGFLIPPIRVAGPPGERQEG